MASLNYTTAFNRYKAKLDNPNWAVSAMSTDGALVISCWEQYFERPADGVLRYVDSLSRWNGSNRAGWNLLRRHLEMTLAGDLEVRLVLAKTDNPNAVAKGGDASKLNNTFSIREDLTGRLTHYDGDHFTIEFRKALQLVGTHLSPVPADAKPKA
ncbi:MAG: hypothetical protein U1C13_00910 [Pseudomonas sp.]|jgi:hypothetical protein|nr:hypothetical protein [Pseudomonas sp.]